MNLDLIESRLQALLEVHLLKHLPGFKVEDGIAQRLAVAMKSQLKEQAGVLLAPNFYVIVAHPSTLARWKKKPRLLKELATALDMAGKQTGFSFTTKPMVTTTSDINMGIKEMHVIASFTDECVAETQGISLETVHTPDNGMVTRNAFLIIDGPRVIPLNRSVINIGRRLDNHIIIDDPRVSRSHAQLRILKDRFVLFDLNSSGGTFVNGRRLSQSVLNPGDVISLAGVSLIFGQDLPIGLAQSGEQTQPGPPFSSNRTTVANQKDHDLPK
jgi:hypothetical protein